MLVAFQQAGYQFQTFEEMMTRPADEKLVVVRHDVDEKAWNALKMAQLEKTLGIRATYFFRIVKQSNVPEVIRQIVNLGHEVGYHYEDLASAEGDDALAIKSFEEHLNYFRGYYPVKSVCMHGSSTSKYDNRLMWEKHALSDFGLVGEPYLSVDFDKIFYLTDTGYAWDGGKFSVRDIVESDFGLKFHTTQQIVECINKEEFPEKVMILAHTLWTDSLVQWYWLHMREFFRNNLKLMAKNNRFVAKFYRKIVNFYWKTAE
ncbi:MAG: hypothetical protein J5792_06020 [Bacteroidales bacterium]|nr:hypothetical protein [Bacteroidales bacterium]